ncbi:TonB family protein [Algoriphagus boseongensis]|uniref:TonB family protein n=1 Tax=Algoriphagus boseongensis TaxID=1442587 RepID=A0A4R6TCA2_9BACT|nr:energy transducer TonB [Algoriphagus boseongensis]TDQ19702.1 TonB family protein [Algoriphagus boseongensis]
MKRKGYFSIFLFLLIGFSFSAFAQKETISYLNQHFYQIPKGDVENLAYTQKSFRNKAKEQVFYILNSENRMVIQKKVGVNQEGGFNQEISEEFDSLNRLIKQTIKNLDNGKYISFYYEEGEKIAEVSYVGIDSFEVWRGNPESKKMSDRDDFYPGLDKTKLNEIFAKNLQYPIPARQKMEQGTVQIALLISEDGKVLKTEVANPGEVSKLLAKEALRVIELYSGPFFPALDAKGNPIQKWMYVPVRFKLG